MAVKTTAELLAEVASIVSNGANAITGDQLNSVLTNIIESYVNTSTNSLDLATNIYRSGFFNAANGNVTVPFTSDLGATNYRVFFDDPLNLISSQAFARTVSGFDVSGIGAGTVRYLAIIDS